MRVITIASSLTQCKSLDHMRAAALYIMPGGGCRLECSGAKCGRKCSACCPRQEPQAALYVFAFCLFGAQECFELQTKSG